MDFIFLFVYLNGVETCISVTPVTAVFFIVFIFIPDIRIIRSLLF